MTSSRVSPAMPREPPRPGCTGVSRASRPGAPGAVRPACASFLSGASRGPAAGADALCKSGRASWLPPPVRAAGQDPVHRGAGQAERPADRCLAVPGGSRRRDRLIACPPGRAGAAGPQRPAVPFGQPAPDAVGDPVTQGVVQARLADRAPRADPPRGLGRLAAAGKEQIKVSAAARSQLTPARRERRWRSGTAVALLAGRHRGAR